MGNRYVPPPEIAKHLAEVVRLIREQIPKGRGSILLYGSWARADAVPSSDLDVAIHGPSPIDGVVMAKIRDQVDELPTLRKTDVVDLASVGEGLRSAILRDGVAVD